MLFPSSVFPLSSSARRRRRLVFGSQHNANPTAHLQPLVAVVGWIPRSLSLLSRDSYLVLIRAGGTQVSTYFRRRSNALSLATQHTTFHPSYLPEISYRRFCLRIHRSISSINLSTRTRICPPTSFHRSLTNLSTQLLPTNIHINLDLLESTCIISIISSIS